MLDKEAFGKRMQSYRISKGLSVNEVAEKCDVTGAHIRQIEAAKKLPGLPMLLSICEELEVTPDALLLDSIKGIRINEINNVVEAMKSLRSDYFKIICRTLEAMMENNDVE